MRLSSSTVREFYLFWTYAAMLLLATPASFAATVPAPSGIRFDRTELRNSWAQGTNEQIQFLQGLDKFEREMRAHAPGWACTGVVTVRWAAAPSAEGANGVTLDASAYLGGTRPCRGSQRRISRRPASRAQGFRRSPLTVVCPEAAALRLMGIARDALVQRVHGAVAGAQAPPAARRGACRAWGTPLAPAVDAWGALEGPGPRRAADCGTVAHHSTGRCLDAMALCAAGAWLELAARDGVSSDAACWVQCGALQEYFPGVETWKSDADARNFSHQEKVVASPGNLLKVQEKPGAGTSSASPALPRMGQSEQAVGWLEAPRAAGFRMGHHKTAPFDGVADTPDWGAKYPP